MFILFAVSPFQIDEVEVIADKTETDRMQVVSLIGHDELAALPITTISDVLAYLPGLDVRSRGTSSTQTDVSMRGGTCDQMVIMLNGVVINDVQTGHYSMNIPISSALIERIEILQEGINIVTREMPEDRYTMQLSAGTNGDIHPLFAGSWARGDAHVNCSVEYGRSEGYYAPGANDKEREALEHTDYQLANIYLQTRWQGLDVQVGAQYKDAGLGTGYGYASTDQFDATRTLFVSGTYNRYLGHNWSLKAQVAYRGQHDRYEWHRGSVTNRHWTHNTQAALQAEYYSIAGTTHVGATVKDEYIASTNMGTHNRLQATLHAGHRYTWQGLTASLDIAGHYHTWFGWYGSGNAQIGYAFLQTGLVSLRADRTLQMPTWTDLYYHAGVQRGSTDLKAEKAWTLALNGRYTWDCQEAGSLLIAGEVYYRLGSDIIDWTYNETDSLYHATNQQKVNTFGVEMTAQYRLNQWLRNISVRYAYTSLSLDIVQTKSMYLDYLRHKVSATIDHGIYVWSKGCIGLRRRSINLCLLSRRSIWVAALLLLSEWVYPPAAQSSQVLSNSLRSKQANNWQLSLSSMPKDSATTPSVHDSWIAS